MISPCKERMSVVEDFMYDVDSTLDYTLKEIHKKLEPALQEKDLDFTVCDEKYRAEITEVRRAEVRMI